MNIDMNIHLDMAKGWRVSVSGFCVRSAKTHIVVVYEVKVVARTVGG